MIEKNWTKEKGKEDPSEALALLRDGIFGSLEIHSLSLALDVPAREVLEILLKGKNWNEGRRDARAFTSMLASQLITKLNLDYLDTSSLKRDGFGFLIPQLDEARLEEYRKARPKKEKGVLVLKPLARSVYGKRMLRSLMITSPTVKTTEDQAKQLLSEYDNFLIELETDTSRTEIPEGPTEQLTLDGEPVSLGEEISIEPAEVDKQEETVQAPLSEYIPAQKKKPTAKEASRKRRKGRRAKKTKGAKGGKK
ncbi:MAG: hypothetical protein ACXAEF_13975 [Candidatus Thorarchaeota archaeon]